ncbi:zinc-ribbon domain-containing protein [Microcella sp.]|uniref:zinc-ribbon domain-containing protein n=1 Tax=Microcella sp. TaxID=1913979 RepID=UPI003919F136
MCQHCGAALPPFALFCGECGRSVSAPAVVPRVVERPTAPVTAPLPVTTPGQSVLDELSLDEAERDEPEPLLVLDRPARDDSVRDEPDPGPGRDEPALPAQQTAPDAVPWSADGPLSIDSPAAVEPAAVHDLAPCTVCGAAREPDDRYCAECGSPLPGDTRIIERLVMDAPPPAVTPPPLPAVTPPPLPAMTTPPRPAAPPPVVSEAPAPSVPAAPQPVPHLMAQPMPVPVPPPTPPVAPDVESTRIVPRGTGGSRFVLQFSTGESYTVLGSGLAGRNPHPEPGEYVDHLVAIVDPGRSVSKTHFEFGQEAGVFWFSDRHSGNGSVIREPGAEPRPCEPGRRYPIVRGTRIDIGEQFVVVS